MSSINGVNTIIQPGFINNNNITQAQDTQENSQFGQVFQAVMDGFNKVNDLQNTSAQAGLDLALGKTDNIHDVLIAQEKAGVALQFTVEVRNKLLDAYNQIMRMPM